MKAKIKTELLHKLKIASKIFSLAVVGIGFSMLLGWEFNIELFKRIHSAFPPAAPNTALCFFLGGILIFFSQHFNNNAFFYFKYAISIFIGLVGFLTLVEYIWEANLGIDKILFFQAQGEAVVRMSPQSAFNFLMLGFALFLINLGKKEKIRLGQFVVLVMGEIALLSLFGYIYGLSSFYTVGLYKGMAAHTAFSFFLVFLAILTSHPNVGFIRVFIAKSVGGIASRKLLFTLLLIILSEILVTLGRRLNFYDSAFESLVHLLIVASAFLYLIVIALRTLDKISEMEMSISKMKEIDRAKTEFVSLASHQLRTPLTSVSWYAEMLSKQEVGSLNEKQKEYLGQVYSQNRRMIELVDDLLNSSRIDMGMLEIGPKKVYLKDIAENVIEEIGPFIREKEIQVERDYPADFPLVETDPELIRIVIQNLISNGVKYTPDKGIVSIGFSFSGSRVQIKVSDTGYGIPRAQQSRVFTKMFRADNIRNKVTDGTGLGLYIAKAIVKELGGRIFFESEEGKGASFFVVLPIKFQKKHE